MYKLWVHNARQVVVLEGESAPWRVRVLEGGAEGGVGVLVAQDGTVAAVGPDGVLRAAVSAGGGTAAELDARGGCVLPGLVDGHTHPVWAGDRVHEFARKLAGATYMDIHREGGGIGFTVAHVRAASEESLLADVLARLGRMLAAGTTLAEAKTGYGLEWATEAKMLRVLEAARRRSPVELVVSYLGAHSVPKGCSAADAARDVCDVQLPALAALRAQGATSAENVDVFFERGVFEENETRAILGRARGLGFALNFHGDELHAMGSGRLAAELGAAAVSHCERLDAADRAAMAAAGVAAVLLPTTAYVLRIDPPDARALIDAGVRVALGSDFNPNAHCLSMPLVMNLACVHMRMTLEEALLGATIHAAYSLRRDKTHGSIAVGKSADLLVLAAPRWEHLIYQMADPPIAAVVKRGDVYRVQHTATRAQN